MLFVSEGTEVELSLFLIISLVCFLDFFFNCIFIALCRYCVSYKLKFCGKPVLSKSITAVFLTAFAHFTCLCYIS